MGNDDLSFADGHDVWEHECPGCKAVIYTKQRRCGPCQADHEEAAYDHYSSQRKEG